MYVKVAIKVYHFVNGDGLLDGKKGLHIQLCPSKCPSKKIKGGSHKNDDVDGKRIRILSS